MSDIIYTNIIYTYIIEKFKYVTAQVGAVTYLNFSTLASACADVC